MSFGEYVDPRVALAVDTARRAYGDDENKMLNGTCTRDRRCLTVAVAALHAAGFMSIADGARAVGLDVKSARVTCSRKSKAFLLVEETVVAVLNGETRDLEAVAREIAETASVSAAMSARWRDPAKRAAFSAPAAVAKRREARAAKLAADPELRERMAVQLRANLAKANAARQAKRAAGIVPARAKREPAPHVARKRGYIRRFLDANWSKREVAYLFDVTPRTVDRIAHG